MQLIRASHQPDAASRQPTETFTGTVHMVSLVNPNGNVSHLTKSQDPIFKADDCMANNVCFTPGARTFWHYHERGQILTVTLGTGFVCSEGQPPQRLRVGDMVHVPANEKHWHGGTNTTCMAHTAISLGTTTWLDEVKKEDYEKAHETAK